jgi:hypothetical protein
MLLYHALGCATWKLHPVLLDYKREVWSFKYHVKFSLESLWSPHYYEDRQKIDFSHMGVVMVYSYSQCYMFHYDNIRKLLEKF